MEDNGRRRFPDPMNEFVPELQVIEIVRVPKTNPIPPFPLGKRLFRLTSEAAHPMRGLLFSDSAGQRGAVRSRKSRTQRSRSNRVRQERSVAWYSRRCRGMKLLRIIRTTVQRLHDCGHGQSSVHVDEADRNATFSTSSSSASLASRAAAIENRGDERLAKRCVVNGEEIDSWHDSVEVGHRRDQKDRTQGSDVAPPRGTAMAPP